MFFSKIGSKRQDDVLTVDYDAEPLLPRGAEKMLRHVPVGKGRVNMIAENFSVRLMPRGMTYLEYMKANPSAIFGDALILDSLVSKLVRNGRVDEFALTSLLGDFEGQLFFLGTTFEAVEDGKKRTCVASFNWCTHYPALRYMFPVDQLVNHNVNCCALHMGALPQFV